MESRVRDKLDRVADLCRKHRVRRLFLIGSAAWGEFDLERSGVDFLVLGSDRFGNAARGLAGWGRQRRATRRRFLLGDFLRWATAARYNQPDTESPLC